MSIKRATATLGHRLGWATTLVLLSWIMAGPDLGEWDSWQWAIARVLNWPVSTAGLLYPDWGGMDLIYGTQSCCFCTTGWFLRQHLVVGVPAYLGLLYAPTALIAVIKRVRGRIRAARSAA